MSAFSYVCVQGNSAAGKNSTWRGIRRQYNKGNTKFPNSYDNLAIGQLAGTQLPTKFKEVLIDLQS